MANYNLDKKDSFTDSAGINKEKFDFWQAFSAKMEGLTLKTIAINDSVFAVNEAVNNKMIYYAGIMTETAAPEEARVIQFLRENT